jgi:hypothetical protein
MVRLCDNRVELGVNSVAFGLKENFFELLLAVDVLLKNAN